MSSDLYQNLGYGNNRIGLGEWPAIVVVDCVRMHFDPEFSPETGVPAAMRETPLKKQLIERLPPLLRHARERNIPVITTRNFYQSDRHIMPYWKIGYVSKSYVAGSPDVEFDPRLADPEYDLMISKTGPSAFHETALQSYLVRNRVDTLLVAGITTSGCIRATVIDGFQRGYRVAVLNDAIADVEEGPHLSNLKDMERRYTDLITTSDAAAYIDTLTAGK